MEVQAVGKYLRISPRKLAPVAALVKRKKAGEALKYLRFVNKRAAQFVTDVLKSAMSNAKNNFDLSEDGLVIKKIEVGKGPMLKRWRAASRGRAHQVLKRTSHLKVIVEGEKVQGKKSEDKQDQLSEQKPLMIANTQKSESGVKNQEGKPKSEKGKGKI